MDSQRFSILLSPNFRFSASYYITSFQCSAATYLVRTLHLLSHYIDIQVVANSSSPQSLQSICLTFLWSSIFSVLCFPFVYTSFISIALCFSGAFCCTLFFWSCCTFYSCYTLFFFFFPFFFFFMLCFPVQFHYTQLCCCFSGARPFQRAEERER